MKYISLIIAALMGVSFFLAAPTFANDIMEGPTGNYTMADVKWEVPISPDRTDTVTGTVEDVTRHLQVLAPEILQAINTSAPGLEAPTSDPVPFGGALVKTPAPNEVKCEVFNFRADAQAIHSGILYLSKLSGKPSNGPNSCGRVSCSYDSAIYWCNDNSDTYTLDSWSMVADGAQAVMNACGPGVNHNKFNGVSLYDGGWKVEVYFESC
ncbi:hypothetical protein INS49_007989 [Diaporthe citri]|uniref:uncharacterized protein n=1 Tax=Diaporthe citri TaxID=83186 RepID=UPI001C7E53EF|nr:uncharacterized protein INS49_007989 [Diaporthe citri]KAG6362894.1 hypothetical protein INS49_007989 [Diaporthe citri]